MPFDGVEYQNAELIYPYETHPWAPMTGKVLRKALTAGYFAARQHGRFLIQQSYGYNGQAPQTNITAGFYISSTSAGGAKAAEGFAKVPSKATHLMAAICFDCRAVDQANWNHRLSIDDGAGHTADGTTVTESIPAGGADPAAFAPSVTVTSVGGASVITPGDFNVALRSMLAAQPSAYLAQCEVAIPGTITLPATCIISLAGWAASAVAAVYKPHFVSIWWECRG